MRLLVVEDDREAANYLRKAFREAGHICEVAGDGEQGLALALDEEFDVFVIDRMLPKRDGLSLISEIRKRGVSTPVLILSALGQVDDRVNGIARGRRRLSRQALCVLRASGAHRGARAPCRAASRPIRSIAWATSNSIASRIRVTRAGKEIPLQPREFRLLEYLMRHAGQVVTRTMLLENVWDYHFDPQTNVIDVHVSRLRAKIDKGFDRQLLHTVRGAGYMIRDSAR